MGFKDLPLSRKTGGKGQVITIFPPFVRSYHWMATYFRGVRIATVSRDLYERTRKKAIKRKH